MSSDAVYGNEFWSFDGQQVHHIANSSGFFFRPFATADALYIQIAEPGGQYQTLWKLANGALTQVSPLRMCDVSWDNRNIAAFHGSVIFCAVSPETGSELWKYDGSTVSLAAEISPGSTGSDPINLFEFQEKLYFSASSSGANYELWRFDGNHAEQVVELASGSQASQPSHFAELNGKLYFSANTNTSRVVVEFDGTNFAQFGSGFLRNPRHLFAWHNSIFFEGETSQYGAELWELKSGELRQIRDFYQGRGSSYPRPSVVIDDLLYIIVQSTGCCSGLFAFDGTTFDRVFDGGPVVEFNGEIYVGYGPFRRQVGAQFQVVTYDVSEPREFYVWNDRLYFAARPIPEPATFGLFCWGSILFWMGMRTSVEKKRGHSTLDATGGF